MPGRLARIVLVLALLAGWQAALQHPIEHVDEIGELVHLHGSGEKNSEAGPLCDLLASLTACAPGGQIAVAALVPQQQSPSYPPLGARLAEAPPFRSQAPPVS